MKNNFLKNGKNMAEKAKRIWKVKKLEPGSFQVSNRKTGKTYKLLYEEFVFGSGLYNSIVETFPSYVHHAIWNL